MWQVERQLAGRCGREAAEEAGRRAEGCVGFRRAGVSPQTPVAGGAGRKRLQPGAVVAVPLISGGHGTAIVTPPAVALSCCPVAGR